MAEHLWYNVFSRGAGYYMLMTMTTLAVLVHVRGGFSSSTISAGPRHEAHELEVPSSYLVQADCQENQPSLIGGG